ncbi:MAG: FG-GAP repeat protein [Acidimicrobiia bacterium]|nr:FG-GAP repeat protein [Acidimicrobiia bacterium]
MTRSRSKVANRRLALALAVAVWVVGLVPAAVAGPGTPEGSARVRADFNGDGFHDLAVGAPYEDLNGETTPGWYTSSTARQTVEQ